MRVFISYCREDAEVAHRLWRDLQSQGISCWLDKEDLLPGQRWRYEIERAIRESDCFLALISTTSLDKTGFVQKELRLALDVLDTIPLHKIYVVPVRLDECEPAHPALRDLQWVDLFPRYDYGLARLLRTFQDPKSKENKKYKVDALKTPVDKRPMPRKYRKVTQGDVIRYYREAKGISVASMAQRLALGVHDYEEIESGNSAAETWGPRLGEIAIKLGVPTSRLVANSGRSSDARAGQCGALIRKHREAKGFTSQQFASIIGIADEELKAIESGKSPLEIFGPLFLRLGEITEQPAFNFLFPMGKPISALSPEDLLS